MSRIASIIVLFFLLTGQLLAQTPTGTVTGKIKTRDQALEFANVQLQGTSLGNVSNSDGFYKISNIPFGSYQLVVSAIGYETQTKSITVSPSQNQLTLDFFINESVTRLSEIVVSGTMKEVSRLESPVAVEVYSPLFFKANPTPSIFESLQNVNGVRPQLNCNVCNTGDIHINGLEGPYTMIMIDGMPIVSGLSTVYGLTGIPQSLIERMEIVKGPASALYGSEAVGGLINIITKKPSSAPLVSIDAFGTTWGESNTDIGIRFKSGAKANSLLGINYFNYQNPIDNNKDGFTDITLQNRISVFNKWSFDRKDNRVFTIAGRLNYEDRWGGDMKWKPQHRGSDVYYGESIYTKRWELFGTYQLPVKEIINFQFSANGHNQNSYYGTTPYFADQFIGFGQFTWRKRAGTRHDLLLGAATRYTFYDDNTPATSEANGLTNAPSLTFLPGIFMQDEIKLDQQNKLLLGARYDYNSLHGSIFSPRLNYKWNSLNKKNTVRISAGNGYRVANVFTEDHAALTGSRQVVFTEALLPETSWNGNMNVVKNFYLANSAYLSLDATAFYTFFNNRIVPDYETDPNKIIYDNLNGLAVSKGISFNTDISFQSGLKILAGGTLMNVTLTENGQTIRQLLTERFSGVWSVGYTIGRSGFSIDYTGNLYGPMRLPLLSELDNRAAYSPWWSVQNIQLTKRFNKGWEIYGGVKNLLNYTPPANSIARPFDPFDKNVQLDSNGKVIPTVDNPYALTFDPSYVFAPNQGTRVFLGMRFTINN